MSPGLGLRDGWSRVSREGATTSFLVSGAEHAETPLVLLPSLGGGAGHWGAFGRRLAAERLTIALDPAGFGHSSAPPALLSTQVLATQLLAALDAVHVDRFDLFGCSLGGLVATRLALLAPRRVRKLVLASTAARGRDFAPRRMTRALELARDFLASAHPKRAIARDIAEHVESGATPREPDVGGAAWSRGRMLHFLSAALMHDVSCELDQLLMPVLVLYGEQDVLLDPQSEQRLTGRLERATLRRLTGVGHDMTNDAPDACAAAVLAFLREN